MTEYTPEDWEIRRDWLLGGGTDAEFERWVDARDARVVRAAEVKALRRAALKARGDDTRSDWSIFAKWLELVAGELESEGA
jgi:hypothetical protein